MRLGFPREWEATPRYSVLSSTPWSPKRWTGEPMAPSGSCSGIEGTGWGWTCLLKPLLRHFFWGGQTCLSYFLEEKVDEFWGPSCLPFITWIPAPTVGVIHIPPAQPGGVNLGSDVQESFLRLPGCCTSRTSLCSATRLTLLSYHG